MSDPLCICNFLRAAPRPTATYGHHRAAVAAAAAAKAAAATAAAATPTSTAMSARKPDIGGMSTLGIRKDTRAHALGVSTLLHAAPSLYSIVRPAVHLRLPRDVTRPRLVTTAVNTSRLASASRNCCNFLSPACRNTATTPGSHALGVSTFYPASWLSAPPSPMCRCSHLARLTGVHRPPPTPPPPPQPNAMSPQGFIALCRWSPLPPQLPPALALPGSLTSRQTPTAPPRAGQATQPGARPPTGTSHRSATLRPAKFHPRLSPL